MKKENKTVFEANWTRVKSRVCEISRNIDIVFDKHDTIIKKEEATPKISYLEKDKTRNFSKLANLPIYTVNMYLLDEQPEALAKRLVSDVFWFPLIDNEQTSQQMSSVFVLEECDIALFPPSCARREEKE